MAGAHANEPVGGATCLRLAEIIAADAGLRARADCTWHFLLCLDPDGSRLNEGWISYGLPNLRGYFREFYRPAFFSQPEFLPAANEARRPMPESEILVALLDELRPLLQFTLHGSEIGGAFVQFTRDFPGAGDFLGGLADDLAVPIDRRPYDGIDWHAAGPGVLVLPRTGGQEERDPAGFSSRTTWLHPAPYGTVTAILEAPAWAVESVSDPTPFPDPAEAIAEAGEILLQRIARVGELLSRTDERLGERAAPFLAAADELVTVSPGVGQTWLGPDFRYVDGSRPATITGNAVSLLVTARRIPLRAAAMLARALATAPGATPRSTRAAAEELVTVWCRELEEVCRPRRVPVRTQAELQARMALRALELVLGPPGAPMAWWESATLKEATDDVRDRGQVHHRGAGQAGSQLYGEAAQ